MSEPPRAVFLSFAGDRQLGLELATRAKRLHPNHPGWYWNGDFFRAYRVQDQRGALGCAPKVNLSGHYGTHILAVVAYGQLGETGPAAKALQMLLALRANNAATIRDDATTWRNPEYAAHLVDGLRKVGLEVADSCPAGTCIERVINSIGYVAEPAPRSAADRPHRGPMIYKLTRTVSWAALCAVSALAGAQDTAPQSFSLPGHGQLQLATPIGWQMEVHQPAPQLPRTWDFSPRAGAPFHVMLTALWPAPPATALPDLATVRSSVAAAAKSAESQSVETSVAVKPLSGAANHGYYFTATDRAPKPGEFKFLTQGMIQVGGVDLAFSVLTNDGQDSVIKEALEVLRSASHKPASN